MSSYQTESQSQAPEQSTEDKATTSEQSASAGNQAELEQAGLSGGGEDDYTLTGPFANLLLDVMPLAEALQAAATVISNPVVQSWLRALPETDLVEALTGDFSLTDFILESSLPVGTGVEVAGVAGISLTGGVELAQAVSMVRTAPDMLHFEAHPVLKLLVGAGVGGKVLDAFGNGADLTAEGEASLAIRADYLLDAPLSLPVLLEYAGTRAADLFIAIAQGLLAPVTGDLPDLCTRSLDIEGVQEHTSLSLVLGGKAQATAQVDSIEELPSPLSTDITQLVDTELMLDATALAQAVGLAEGTLTIHDLRKATFGFRTSISGAAQVAASLSPLLPEEEQAALGGIAGLSGAGEVAAELGFDPTLLASEGEAPATTKVTLTVATGAGVEGGGKKALDVSTTTMAFDSFGAAASALASDVNECDANGSEAIPGTEANLSLTDLLAEEGGGPTVEETLKHALDPARLADEVSDLGKFLGVDELAGQREVGVIASDSELLLSGVVPVTPADFQAAADTGIVLPGAVPRGKAFADVAQAIAAARGAGDTPGWLSEWEQGLQSVFSGQDAMTQGRLKGFIGVGAGGELAAEEVAKASGKAAGTTKFLIDRAGTEDDIATLLAAM